MAAHRCPQRSPAFCLSGLHHTLRAPCARISARMWPRPLRCAPGASPGGGHRDTPRGPPAGSQAMCRRQPRLVLGASVARSDCQSASHTLAPAWRLRSPVQSAVANYSARQLRLRTALLLLYDAFHPSAGCAICCCLLFMVWDRQHPLRRLVQCGALVAALLLCPLPLALGFAWVIVQVLPPASNGRSWHPPGAVAVLRPSVSG